MDTEDLNLNSLTEDELILFRYKFYTILVVNEWKSIFRCMGVSEDEIERTLQNEIDVKEQIHKLILEIFRNPPTFKGFKTVLEEQGLLKSADDLEQLVFFPQKFNHSSTERRQKNLKFNIVAEFIAPNWKNTARNLGLSEKDIKSIDLERKSCKEKSYKALTQIEELKIFFDWIDIKPQLSVGIANEIEEKFVRQKINYRKETDVNDLSFLDIGIDFDVMNNNSQLSLDNVSVIHEVGNKSKILFSLNDWYSEGQKIYMRFSKLDFIACHEDKNDKLLEHFLLYFKRTQHSFIFSNYDIVEHCEHIGLKNIIQDHMKNLKIENLKSDFQYMAYEFDRNIVYFIQFSNEYLSKEIKKDINSCVYSLQLFCTLYRSILLKLNVSMVPIVVVRSKEDDIINYCKAVKIVTYREFYNWGKSVKDVIIDDTLNVATNNNQDNDVKMQEVAKLVGSILIYMEKFNRELFQDMLSRSNLNRNCKDMEKDICSKLSSIVYQALSQKEDAANWSSVFKVLSSNLHEDDECRSEKAVEAFRNLHLSACQRKGFR